MTFERFWEIPQQELGRAAGVKELLVETQVRQVSWVGPSLSESPWGANALSRLMESTDLVHTCTGMAEWKTDSTREPMVAVSTSVPRNSCFDPCPSSPCPEVSKFSSSMGVPGVFQAAAPRLELRASVSVHWPLKNSCYGNSSALAPWLGNPVWSCGPFLLRGNLCNQDIPPDS